MPKYGGSSDYSTVPSELDPLQFTPNFGDTAGASVSVPAEQTIARQGIDRLWLEAGWSPIGSSPDQQQTMTINEANQKYGLDLKPTYAKRVSVGLAEYFQRKNIQSQIDQAVMQQAPPDPVTGFLGGVVASFTDPAELLLNTVLLEGAPLTGLAKSAQLSLEAGEIVRPSVAARFFSRFPGKTALTNPLLSGAVEGAGSVALMSPLTYFNSQALGKKYTLDDALTSIAASGVVGAGLGGIHSLLTSGFSKVRPMVADHGAPIDPLKAHMSAEVDMNNGNPVDVARSIDVAQRTKDLADARAEVEQQVLNTRGADPTVKESLPVGKTIRLYRGVVEGRSNGLEQTTFWSPDRTVAESYARGMTGTEKTHVLDQAISFRNLYETNNWVTAKQELGLPKDTPMPEVLNAIEKAGYDGVKWKGASGIEYVKFAEKARDSVLEPVDLTNPEAVRHTTPLEQRLLAVTDPEGFKAVMQNHLTEINLNIAKLGELLHLPEADRLAANEDIKLLQNEIMSKFANLNEILPVSEKGLPTEFKTTNKGIMTQKSLQVIGKEISRLNDLAVREMDEPTRLATMQAEHTKLTTELKKAMSQLKQGQAKGWATVEDWQKKVSELTPRLEHASRLLQAHGVDVKTPELSLAHYVDSLGENLPPALKDFLDQNPGKLQEPLYRVRNSIFDAIRARMDQTQKYLQDIDYTQPVRKFPEDDEILRELNTFMNTEGQGTMDPTAIHEEAAKVIDQQINEYKSLGIFDEKNIERFDNIKKQFDEQLQKTDAVKKGSLQAQICALGGVTEEE